MAQLGPVAWGRTRLQSSKGLTGGGCVQAHPQGCWQNLVPPGLGTAILNGVGLLATLSPLQVGLAYQSQCIQKSQGEETKMAQVAVSWDQITEVTSYQFHHILFIRSESTDPPPHRG